MDGERAERLIKLILSTGADESEKTKRIEMVLKQYQLYEERRDFF